MHKLCQHFHVLSKNGYSSVVCTDARCALFHPRAELIASAKRRNLLGMEPPEEAPKRARTGSLDEPRPIASDGDTSETAGTITVEALSIITGEALCYFQLSLSCTVRDLQEAGKLMLHRKVPGEASYWEAACRTKCKVHFMKTEGGAFSFAFESHGTTEVPAATSGPWQPSLWLAGEWQAVEPGDNRVLSPDIRISTLASGHTELKLSVAVTDPFSERWPKPATPARASLPKDSLLVARLPQAWVQLTSRTSGRMYYYNTRTGVSQNEVPR